MLFDIRMCEKLMNNDTFSLLKTLLHNCPKHIKDQMELCKFDRNSIIMTSNSSLDYVYVLLYGNVEALEEYTLDFPYPFTSLSPLDFLGDYELFSGYSSHYATLKTTSVCYCIKLDSASYLQWMQTDIKALFLRTQIVLKQLSFQTQYQRQFLSLDTKLRIVLFLQECVEDKHLPVTIEDNRNRIASKLGISIRTLNRTLPLLEQNQLLTRLKGKIVIDKIHEANIKKYIQQSQLDLKLTIPNNK